MLGTSASGVRLFRAASAPEYEFRTYLLAYVYDSAM
jgi:hypothetical protein